MAMVEIWFPIEGYQNYSISDRLRFRNNRTRTILKQIVNNKGYVQVHFVLNNKSHKKTVHRLIARQFLPNPHGKPEINHKDGDKTNNLIKNFEWVTHQENCQHAYDTGLNLGILEAAKASARARLAKTHCKNGHLLDGLSKRGWRFCKTCINESQQLRRKGNATPRIIPTHCKNGHPFDGHNGTQKTCSICSRAAKRRYKERMKAQRARART